ncbi:MAG TPA: 30S ribosome-binding factor RbfA [Blastocatellia bacterium]|nr:30S ribosome-binding factor RbfA [Blastocatellia bacterium]
MPGRRAERLAEQIKEEISLIIAGEVEDPKVGFVTVTDAKLSDDLRNAKIYVSVLGSEDEVKHSMTALRHAAGFIRHQLGAAIRMKRTPDLHFVYDDTERTAARIEELLTEEVATARKMELDQHTADPDSSGSSLADEHL